MHKQMYKYVSKHKSFKMIYLTLGRPLLVQCANNGPPGPNVLNVIYVYVFDLCTDMRNDCIFIMKSRIFF